MEKISDANQAREQAVFRKGFATTDHIHTLNQVIQKAMNSASLYASHTLITKKPSIQLNLR